jgi:hypothetical protein
MRNSIEFLKIFERLKRILKKYDKKFKVVVNNEFSISYYGGYSAKFKQDLYFGGTEIKKNYVSFHLMPVYMYQELIDSIPEILKNRMQGKSCFNFKKFDEPLFKELELFTEKAFSVFKERGENVTVANK